MTTHLHLYTPSSRGRRLTQVSILLLVMMTGLVSIWLVRSQMHRYDLQPEAIPIAHTKTWDALGR